MAQNPEKYETFINIAFRGIKIYVYHIKDLDLLITSDDSL
jgi:hypothetical protein